MFYRGIFASLLVVIFSSASPRPAMCSASLPYSQVFTHFRYSCSNHIPPRFEWDNNDGYCGEVSLISAGLYYGQYVSQYDVRAMISNGKPQNRCQLLVGINDSPAIAKMHLNALTWNTQAEEDTDQFVAWIKQNVVKGYPVYIGVYMNQYLFYGDTNPNAGDLDYDHIVPVYGFTSYYPLTDPNYFGTDIFYFSDNGLWKHQYLFSSNANDFQSTRAEANAEDGLVYSLPNTASNYGTAITGIKDLNRDTLPVRIDTNVNYEKPEIKEGSDQRPAPMPLELTITISKLQPGVLYHLYRYNHFDAVPDSNFNTHASNAYEHWQVSIDSGSTFTMKETILSDEIAVYRAVRADAP